LIATLLMLFAGFESPFESDTDAELMISPAFGGSVAATSIVADAPASSVPRAQVIVVMPLHVPFVVETELSVTPDGTESTTLTSVALALPMFDTNNVQVTGCPTT
jgi:hypothetical protein